EQHVGRKNMDSFLVQYFHAFAFTTINTETFLNFLDQHLLDNKDSIKSSLNISEWIYGTGIPDNYPVIDSVRFITVQKEVNSFVKNNDANLLQTDNWSTYEWLYFLRSIRPTVDTAQMRTLDKKFDFTYTQNSEIACIWFEMSIKSKYMTSFAQMRTFLNNTGRMKFLEP